MITELTYCHSIGIHEPVIGVDFRNQPHDGTPRCMFIRVLLDCADNFLVVKTLAVKTGLRPSKLPDIRAFFATISLHTSAFHLFLLHRRGGAEESSGMEANGRAGGCNQSSELPCSGSPAT